MNRATWNDSVKVVFVGETSRPELAGCVDWWRQLTQPRCYRSLHELWQESDELDSIELLILAQSRLGEFPETMLQRVLARHPLARTINVYGSWCESESRTGSPPLSVIRIPWTHAVSRFSAELQGLNEGRCPSWSWPWTASDDELDFSTSPPRHGTGPLRCGIATASEDMFDALAQLLATGNIPSDRLPSDASREKSSLDVIVWDDCASARGLRFDLGQLVASCADTPLVALVDFPREFDQARLGPFKRASLLAKPYRAGDFLHAVVSAAESLPAPSGVGSEGPSL
jgi:hypothetical protein